MTQEEIEKLAVDDALVNCSKLKGYSSMEQLVYKRAFISGYQEAQKIMFTEDEIRKAYQNYDDIKGWFECVDFLIKELKQIKLKQHDF